LSDPRTGRWKGKISEILLNILEVKSLQNTS
jgi:hypothetical protein